jgi:hypothetical protein
MARATIATIRPVLTEAQEDAIRGIRAAFPPRKVMVSNRNLDPLWGCAVAKAGGDTYLVMKNGQIRRCDS